MNDLRKRWLERNQVVGQNFIFAPDVQIEKWSQPLGYHEACFPTENRLHFLTAMDQVVAKLSDLEKKGSMPDLHP